MFFICHPASHLTSFLGRAERRIWCGSSGLTSHAPCTYRAATAQPAVCEAYALAACAPPFTTVRDASDQAQPQRVDIGDGMLPAGK